MNLPDPYTLSFLLPARTGLPFVLWLSLDGGERQDARIYISNSPTASVTDLIPVAINPEIHVHGDVDSHDLTLLRDWIEINREVIEAHWCGEIEDSGDALGMIKPVKDERLRFDAEL